MRSTTIAAGLLLLSGLLAGCGSENGDPAPADAGEQEFCDAYADLFGRVSQMEPGDTSGGIRALKEWAADMQDVGTPANIPDDARDGFETLLNSIENLDEDATEQELEELAGELGQGDQKEGEAFVGYAMKTCPDAMGGLLDDLEQQMGELTESPRP